MGRMEVEAKRKNIRMNTRLIFTVIAVFFIVDLAALTFFFADDIWPSSKGVVSQTSELPTRLLDIDGRVFTVEIVSSPEDVRQGLSDRPSLDRDRGMLF